MTVMESGTSVTSMENKASVTVKKNARVECR